MLTLSPAVSQRPSISVNPRTFGQAPQQMQMVPTPGPATQGICTTPEAMLFRGACCGNGRENSRVNAAGQCAPPGFHWNKASYTRIGGPCSTKPAGFVEKGTELIKNRRKFNNANGPAQARAISRLSSGEKQARALLKMTGFRTISKQSSREMRMRRRGTRH